MPPRDALSEFRLALGLLAVLGDGARHRVADTAKRLGVTPVDVERAASTLTMAGRPPYTPLDLIDIEIDGDEIVLASGVADALHTPARLTLAEAEALDAALTLVEGRLEPQTAAALRGLRDKVSASLTAATRSAPSLAALPGDEDPGVLAALRRATWGRERLTIESYSAARGETRRRVVEPWALVDRGGEWYLVAFCRDAGARRVFKVSRIKEAETTGETFELPADLDHSRLARDPFGEVQASRRARLRFVGEAARWVRERWPEYLTGGGGGAAAAHEAGGIGIDVAAGEAADIEIPYTDETWMVRELLPYAGEVIVEGPVDLRARFATTLEDMAARYRG
jgi:predicted DNA-binding transcriptional regulator YafY